MFRSWRFLVLENPYVDTAFQLAESPGSQKNRCRPNRIWFGVLCSTAASSSSIIRDLYWLVVASFPVLAILDQAISARYGSEDILQEKSIARLWPSRIMVVLSFNSLTGSRWGNCTPFGLHAYKSFSPAVAGVIPPVLLALLRDKLLARYVYILYQ